MKTLRKQMISLMAMGLLLPCPPMMGGQTPTPGAKPGPPPVIDESVPPPFDKYTLGPDSLPHSSVPTGKTFKFDLTKSRTFPNTSRTITVYVPAAYSSDKPACVYVGLDGLGYNMSTVFDNLIAQHAMPVTIAIGLAPGSVNSTSPPDNPRFDRSFEFDSLNDRLARFLIEEVIPEVEQRRTPDGAIIKLSPNPDDRAIGGGSTGGIGAFTVAWERPDAFRRVFISIGTFVGMRGGEGYYVRVRKTEPKPLRIFMQDGVHDEWGGGPEMGDWWMSNQTMNRALEFAGYDVRHVWGSGTHNGSQAAAIFPDAMRWLWRDWPTPLSAAAPGNPVLKSILQPGQVWKTIEGRCGDKGSVASDQQGKVFYRSGEAQPISLLNTEVASMSCDRTSATAAFAFGPDGNLYLARAKGGVEIKSQDGHTNATVRAEHLVIRNFTVRNSGDIYAATQSRDGKNELWLIPSKGDPKRLDEDLKEASGIALSPDGLWLLLAQSLSRTGLSYRVLPDGTLDSREPFYDFYVPAWADDSGASGVSMDRDGRAYVATRIGVQIFDRNGRVTAILPLPGNEPATGICFGGKDFRTLYVLGGGKIYQRQLFVPGATPAAPPIKLPPWGAG
jgi:enterochelin esterase-like enzyme